jgi:hypothetical protein
MSKVDEILSAIEKLTWDERAELNRRLGVWEDDEWDKQMEQDAAAGKFDRIIDKIKDDEENGRLRDFPF